MAEQHRRPQPNAAFAVSLAVVAMTCAGCGGRVATAATRPALKPVAAAPAGRSSLPKPTVAARAPDVSPANPPSLSPGDATRLTGVPGPGQADFEIRIDPAALAARHLDAAVVTAAVSRFFETYPLFSLTDLQEMKVPTPDGAPVRLRDVAEVEVWFGAARTQVVVRDRKP